MEDHHLEALERLAKLKQDGILNEEEFRAEKARIFGILSPESETHVPSAPDSREKAFDLDSSESDEAESLEGMEEPKPPEWGFGWSLALSPIAGAVFGSRNWARIGRPDNQTWTWVSAIAVMVVIIGLAVTLDTFWPALVVDLLWQLSMFAWQRNAVPQDIKSVQAYVAAGVLLAFNVGYGLYSAPSASLTIGTSVDGNASDLTVSGTDYAAGATIYARLYSPSPFSSTSVNFLLEEKAGAGWSQIFDQPATVSPSVNIAVKSFQVPEPGTYKMEAIIGNDALSETVFAVLRYAANSSDPWGYPPPSAPPPPPPAPDTQ